jgi:S-adenosylmethionine hydrolase
VAAPLAFVTDFGSADTYAAALVAACWRVDPGLHAIVGMHGVPPGDVLGGAYHVKALAQALPAGAVMCAVVDPGVGTERGAVAVEAGGIRCVAPDNGLLSYLWSEAELQGRRCVALRTPADASATFHGRDVFAPVAARLAVGGRLDEVGAPSLPPALLDDAFARVDRDVVSGVVCVVDGFGNAITTVRSCDVSGRRVAGAEWDGGATMSVVRTYADITNGSLAILLGSAGHWEVAARSQPAASLGGPGRGDVVRVLLA